MVYDNLNKGVLGKNTRKTEDNHPDITGSLNVNGVDHWINGWLKKNSKDGSTFYSLSVKPKEARQAETPPARGYGDKSSRQVQSPAFEADDDSSIPF